MHDCLPGLAFRDETFLAQLLANDYRCRCSMGVSQYKINPQKQQRTLLHRCNVYIFANIIPFRLYNTSTWNNYCVPSHGHHIVRWWQLLRAFINMDITLLDDDNYCVPSLTRTSHCWMMTTTACLHYNAHCYNTDSVIMRSLMAPEMLATRG